MNVKKINGVLAFLLTEKEVEKISILLGHNSVNLFSQKKPAATNGSRLPGDRYFKYAKGTEDAVATAERNYGIGNWVYLSDPELRASWATHCTVAIGKVLEDQRKRGYVEVVKSAAGRVVKFRFIKKHETSKSV